MSIFDDINSTKNIAELQELYQDKYMAIYNLKLQIKEDKAIQSEISDKISAGEVLLNGYGDTQKLRAAFYEKLGRFHKAELN